MSNDAINKLENETIKVMPKKKTRIWKKFKKENPKFIKKAKIVASGTAVVIATVAIGATVGGVIAATALGFSTLTAGAGGSGIVSFVGGAWALTTGEVVGAGLAATIGSGVGGTVGGVGGGIIVGSTADVNLPKKKLKN